MYNVRGLFDATTAVRSSLRNLITVNWLETSPNSVFGFSLNIRIMCRRKSGSIIREY